MHLRDNQATIYEYFRARIMQNCHSNLALFFERKYNQNLRKMVKKRTKNLYSIRKILARSRVLLIFDLEHPVGG